MFLNFNIGLLGHVDSGKTTLARRLSTVASTAAFDKNPQSQERGITLDLGFSACLAPVPPQLAGKETALEKLQYTFVDCPGHASLIRTIIGGAQIIDLMILVVDAQKGVQTQTAECIVIGELLRRRLIVVVNKVDLLPATGRDSYLAKLNAKLRKTLARTTFGGDVPIYNISALDSGDDHLQPLLEGIAAEVHMPQRDPHKPFLMYVDHCFSIRGQGTVCTGTIVQGSVAVNAPVEIPAIGEQRKVKSIQMFRQSVAQAQMGDRVGLCVTQFNAKQLERGVLCSPGSLRPIYAGCVLVRRIPYYRGVVKSRCKLHMTVGHETVMGVVTLFRGDRDEFDTASEYEYVEELGDDAAPTFALVEFEKPLLCRPDATLIASKLDMDAGSQQCRLVFWGELLWRSHSANYAADTLPSTLRVYKWKSKEGSILRLVNEHEAIVQNLFKKESNRDLFVGMRVELSTGEAAVIDSSFGQSAKVKIRFRDELRAETLSTLRRPGGGNEVKVLLRYKKYVFNKKVGVVQ